MPGAITGRMLDLGYHKLPLGIASVVLVVCAFLVAECKEYWQFLLCQGIGMGVSTHPFGLNLFTTASSYTARMWLYLSAVARLGIPMVYVILLIEDLKAQHLLLIFVRSTTDVLTFLPSCY